jgi:hypothetical protein
MLKESSPELRAQNKEPQNFRLIPETLRKSEIAARGMDEGVGEASIRRFLVSDRQTG